MDNILSGPAISKHDNPTKLMIMLHGYGDNAANFVHLAEPLDLDEWGMHYVALNAPSIMPGNPMGYQWFDLYINGIYISDAGPKEYEVINKIIRENVSKINNTISLILKNLSISLLQCSMDISIKEPGLTTNSFLKDLIEVIISIKLLTSF